MHLISSLLFHLHSLTPLHRFAAFTRCGFICTRCRTRNNRVVTARLGMVRHFS